MLRSKDMIGLPIFTIAEGKEIGKITEMLVNPSRGIVVALTIENTSKILTFSSIKSIGKDAVVVDSISQLMELSEHKNIDRWKDIKIVDSKVITSSGRHIGQVSDYLIDIVTGKIISCVANDLEGERLVIPASRIVTFGRDALIVVDEDLEEAIAIGEKEETEEAKEVMEIAKEERKAEHEEIKTVLEQLAEEIEKGPEEAPRKPESEPTKEVPAASKPQVSQEEKPQDVTKAPTKPASEEAPKTEPVETAKQPVQPPVIKDKQKAPENEVETKQHVEPSQEIKKDEVPPQTKAEIPKQPVAPGNRQNVPEQTEAVPKKTPKPSGTGDIKRPEEQVQAILDKHQHDFLLGKTVKKDLLADDGSVILKAGESITEESLEKARKANKYLELGFYI